MRFYFYIAFVLFFIPITNAQDVELFQQLGGRIDFTMIGNTMNLEENGPTSSCSITTESSAVLNLDNSDILNVAYLYWAGSGEGDFDIKLNDISIVPSRTFSDLWTAVGLPFFSAFADITEQIKNTGNGTYTLSELDVSGIIDIYCPNATNFAGWSILLVYQNDSLPLNQINIYDGLQHVPDELTIQLNNLNVIDNQDAKIGFLAWEGDVALSVNESLLINGNLISNPPLNPGNNAFNGTNSFTNQSNLYNMDMDFYTIQDNIDIGDTSASVQLTSGQDFVMINTIITKLNSQLPDAIITIDNYEITSCDNIGIKVNLTVSNTNSTDVLPANTEISIYVNDILLESFFTTNDLPIDASEAYELTILIPESELPDFILKAIVDEEEIVLEISESNNSDEVLISFPLPPETIEITNFETCNLGLETGVFDLSETYEFIRENYNSDVQLTFFPTENDLLNNTNSINTALTYNNIYNPQTLYIKTENTLTGCYVINTFELIVINCPPIIPEAFSPNGDGLNEEFKIMGLTDIFTEYSILIYNRYGNLVHEGNNNLPLWNGTLLNTNKLVPTGTYFYTLYLNDSNYKSANGWVYMRR
ncbi:MAG: gliding motility-associated-like protein [Candidatus Azotimanducaceae bacterium]|jgi:gliding motility-associated-like protein